MKFKKNMAIIGAGPAGCMCAYFAMQNNNVTLFDFASPLHTLLYTGGGRCNLTYEEYDFKELVKFYPRGEKFLYSVFSQFAVPDTIDFFKEIGIETYVQDDLRIFPISNSAKDIRYKFLEKLKICTFKREKVVSLKKENNNFMLKTELNTYFFDKVVIAIGGRAGYEIAEQLGHKIVTPKPALSGLITKENFKMLQGVSLKNVEARISFNDKKNTTLIGDLLFTHNGISGPLTYTISSICARLDYSMYNPLSIALNFLPYEIDFQNLLNANSKKDVKNLISDFVPKALAEYICKKCDALKKCYEIDGATRDLIVKYLSNFPITIISPAKEGEIVTSGGICLDEINSKTMESKLINGLYFCGEVIDVDGLCGGFNLQNCWSSGFIAGNSLNN